MELVERHPDWRLVSGSEDYAVSRSGEVYSYISKRMLRPHLSKGYRRVRLRRAFGSSIVSVHTLVCSAFNGPRPTATMHCAHLDGNAENNHADNLRWVSQAENEAHKKAHGTACVGGKSPHAKLTDEQAALVRKAVNGSLTRAEWATLLGISPRALSQLLRGETYSSRLGHSATITIAGENL